MVTLATAPPELSRTVPAMVPRSDCARAVIPENVRKTLKQRNLSRDTLNRITPPKQRPITEQTRPSIKQLFALSSEPLKSQPPVTSPGKSADRVVPVIGFRNRLLATRLSALPQSCQALFLIAIWSFDGRSLRT